MKSSHTKGNAAMWASSDLYENAKSLSPRERHALLIQREGGNPRSKFSKIVLKTAFFSGIGRKIEKTRNHTEKGAFSENRTETCGLPDIALFQKNCIFRNRTEKTHFEVR